MLVTSALLNAHRERGHDRGEVAAVLAHDQAGGVRWVPVVSWLALPWRVVFHGAVRSDEI